MANPLINLLGASSKGVSSGNKSIVQQFIEFKNSFKGDPQKKLNELISSGKVTQEQVDQATQLANLIKGYSKR